MASPQVRKEFIHNDELMVLQKVTVPMYQDRPERIIFEFTLKNGDQYVFDSEEEAFTAWKIAQTSRTLALQDVLRRFKTFIGLA